MWGFERETDHLIPARRPDLVIVRKIEYLPLSELCRPGGLQGEDQRKQKERQVLLPKD